MLGALVKGALAAGGFEIHRVPKPGRKIEQIVPSVSKIHYACGHSYLDAEWLNVDILPKGPANYMYVNLVDRHPFPDDSFRYALCEDFIEHVGQADALIFLCEVHRTLRQGGVLRLSSPLLELVLTRHYPRIDYATFALARRQAFVEYGHLHFFARSNIEAVANHIGYDLKFVNVGESRHPELRGIDVRNDVINFHAELTKR
jgi:SAM-dependent methyltransferase